MASASVKECTNAWWTEVYNRVIGAIVFIDDASAECLHWEGGLFNLMTAGAVMVKTLSSFETCPKSYQKAVFITQASGRELNTICEIVKKSSLTHCILISCVSLDVVYFDLNVGKDVSDVIAAGKGTQEATKILEGVLYQNIGNKDSIVDVIHIPIFAVSLTNVIFTTPPFDAIYPLIDGKIITSPVNDLYQLSDVDRSSVRRIASGLNSLLGSMNLKEEVYFMGTFSSLVASVLENSPVCMARRKKSQNPGSLIIIDRTLDVCGVTSHCTESMLDIITAVLPRFPGQRNESAVDMSPLCEADIFDHPRDVQLSPGCLFHAKDESCVQTYDHMINKSQKEVMVDVYNKLSKIDVERSPSPKNLLRVTPQSIEKIVNGLKGNYHVIEKNLGLVQQALAVVQTLKSPRRQHIELMQNLEKQVLQSLTASRDSTSVLFQITQLIKTRHEKKMPIVNLIALLVHVYSLTGTEFSFSQEHEEHLLHTLGAAYAEDYKNLVGSEPEEVVTPEAAVAGAKILMDRLQSISIIRKSMQRYSSVLKPCEDGSGEEYKGLTQQLVEDLVNSDRPELVDLSHRSEGFKDLLLTGFSMLTSKKSRAAKHPLDNPVVIIYVIGGMTAEECKRLHRTVITSGVDNTVLFGTTRLVTPTESTRDIFNY